MERWCGLYLVGPDTVGGGDDVPGGDETPPAVDPHPPTAPPPPLVPLLQQHVPGSPLRTAGHSSWVTEHHFGLPRIFQNDQKIYSL